MLTTLAVANHKEDLEMCKPAVAFASFNLI